MKVVTKAIDSVLVITLSCSPVNALGFDVRNELSAALDRIDSDNTISAALITSGERVFCGGADINEFGKTPQPPFLPDLLNRISGARVPFVAAVDGAALGGGCELALACHYRIIGSGASFGLPEVRLGLIPGAGGTQRLPRLIGIEKAAELIASGGSMTAQEAMDAGLADQFCKDNLLDVALEFASKAPYGRAHALKNVGPLPNFDEAAWDKLEKKIKTEARGRHAPLKALEAVKLTTRLSLPEGLKAERDIFLDCMNSQQRQGLIHAFKVERAVRKIEDLDGVSPRQVAQVGVLGAGMMGSGIATALVESGYEVLLFDTNEDALFKGVDCIYQNVKRRVAKGRITEGAGAEMRARLKPVITLESMGSVQLVIEAVIERMDVKKAVFSKISNIVQPATILASNTSYLDINRIADAAVYPENVVGMHFFSPANIMRLLEIVRPERASKEAVATAMALGQNMKKICVLAGVCDGFIGNRIFKKYREQAECLVEDGAMPQEVDNVMRDFGFPMGPFEVSDLAGLDIGWHNRRREDATRDPSERYVELSDKLYDMGRLGQKAKAGWYAYADGARKPIVDPVVEALILEHCKAKGINRRDFSEDDIRNRLVGVMINEGAAIIEEQIAKRPLDVDAVLVHGYGFPSYRGGPMHYADQFGLENVVPILNGLAAIDAPFAPTPLLVKLASEGGGFGDLNDSGSTR